MGWYAILLVICLGGFSLIAYSRYELTHPAVKAAAAQVPPTKNNLWEVGLDLDLCGKISQLPASSDAAQAYTTNGDGVVSIEPARATTPSLYTGTHATLNAFLISDDLFLQATSIQLPTPTTTTTTSSTSSTTSTTAASTTTSTTASSSTSSTSSTTTTTVPVVKPKVFHNGDLCHGKVGYVQVEVWKSPSAKTGTVLTKDPGALRFRNGQLITIAFVPKHTSIPKPTSASQISAFLLSNPSGLVPSVASSATSTTAVSATSTTAGSSSTTSSSSAATSTTKAG